MPQVIIVSLIDIFAILLIFVIVTTTFKKDQPSVAIRLPESQTAVASDQPATPVVLTVSAEEEIFLDTRPVAIADLKAALEELLVVNPKQTLALNADTKAPFGFIVQVLDVLKEAGVKGSMAAFMDRK